MGLFNGNNQQGNQDMQTQQQTNDPFAAIGNADPTERSNWILPGVYPVLFCDKIKLFWSEEKQANIFVAEFDILESEVTGRPVGTSMAWVCNLRHKPTPGNIRAFIAELFGTTVVEVDGDSVRAVCGSDNPAQGRLIRCEATETTTKKGNPFTQCKWSAIPADMQEKSKELRDQAGYIPF